ncbi:MAG: helix-turn-helix domain-containing protein [Acidaminococcales bacterium]|jgi:putative transcriptional regulator|nr:helix-turn-helix domain-containing protein [Acidaminococcales bacterium]
MKELARERKRKIWTQEFVARKIGITKAAYSNIETGKRKPSYEILCKLEALFGKPHSELLRAGAAALDS